MIITGLFFPLTDAEKLNSAYRESQEMFKKVCKDVLRSNTVAQSMWRRLSDDVKAVLRRLGYKPEEEDSMLVGEFALNKANDTVKKTLLKSCVPLITEDNKYALSLGDFVRDADEFYMVMRPKSETEDGVLAALNVRLAKWYYRLKYSPYSRLDSDDDGCRLGTGAYNRLDGRINTTTILKLNHDLVPIAYDPYRCPPDSHFFPAFNFVEDIAGTYIPAIEELHDIFISKDVLAKLNERLQECLSGTIPTDVDVLIWSSTDNRSNLAYGGEALALMLRPDKHIIVQSIPKNKEAIVLPFKRF